jgi:membrane fusion protein, hemolysin D
MAPFAREPSRSREELEFLPAALEVLGTPPRPAARMTALVICLFLLAALVWSIVGHVDTVAIAQGQIVPAERVKLIQPLESVIVRAIHVRDGQVVNAGDVLVELDPTDAETNVEALKSDFTKAKLDVAITTALISDKPRMSFAVPESVSGLLVDAARSQLLGEVEKLEAEIASASASIEEQKAERQGFELRRQKAIDIAPILEDRLGGLELLNKQNLVRKPELHAARQVKIENISENATAEAGIRQTDARIAGLTNRIEELRSKTRADALERRAEALRKVASLEQQIKREERRQADRQLRAPVAGTIMALSVHTVGGVVTTKDVLMRIVPAGSRHEIECPCSTRTSASSRRGRRLRSRSRRFRSPATG